MEKISFDIDKDVACATFTKEATTFLAGETVLSLTVSAEANHPLLLWTADEVPFFFYDKKAHLIGAAVISKNDTLNEVLKRDMHKVMVQYNLIPEDIICYLGPSLTFAHTTVERPVIVEIMNMGYRAAAKRTSGVDFFDVPVMNVIMLRNLGIAPHNIYLDSHDTFECDKLFYSALRGDKKKNLSYIEMLE